MPANSKCHYSTKSKSQGLSAGKCEPGNSKWSSLATSISFTGRSLARSLARCFRNFAATTTRKEAAGGDLQFGSVICNASFNGCLLYCKKTSLFSSSFLPSLTVPSSVRIAAVTLDKDARIPDRLLDPKCHSLRSTCQVDRAKRALRNSDRWMRRPL